MRQATRLVVALVIAVAATTVAPSNPARAANVTVRFGVSVGHYAPGACLVSVPQGTGGIGVLNAAVKKGCIKSYQMDGYWLRCVELAAGGPICSDVHKNPMCCGTHYWAVYEDGGAVAPHAVADFSAHNVTHHRLTGAVPVAHEELVLSYESWGKCLGYPALCNPDV